MPNHLLDLLKVKVPKTFPGDSDSVSLARKFQETLTWPGHWRRDHPLLSIRIPSSNQRGGQGTGPLCWDAGIQDALFITSKSKNTDENSEGGDFEGKHNTWERQHSPYDSLITFLERQLPKRSCSGSYFTRSF